MALMRYPLLSSFKPAGTAGFRLAALAEKTGMGAVDRCTAIATNAHLGGATGEHALDAEAGPGSDAVTKFFEKLIPAVMEGEEQLCRARNIHAAEYKTGLRACKPSVLRSSDARPARALRSLSWKQEFRLIAEGPLLNLFLHPVNNTLSRPSGPVHSGTDQKLFLIHSA